MRQTNKLQIPMPVGMLRALTEKSEDLGFDSVQAYVRFWAKAEVDGRGAWGKKDMYSTNAQALRYVELILAYNGHEFETVSYAITYIKRTQQRRYSKDAPQGDRG